MATHDLNHDAQGTARIDRTAFRVVDADVHFREHDARLLDYWRGQPLEARLAAAQQCRRRVDGAPKPIDRTHFPVIDPDQTDRW